MTKTYYKYKFSEAIDIDEVKDSLYLAACATESIHGRTAFRLEAKFSLNQKNRICTINTDSFVGSNLAHIFTGFILKEFGEASFKVEKCTSKVKLDKVAI